MNRSDWVNLLQGTKNEFHYSHGNILPIAGLPHGFTGYSIQTNEGNAPFWFDPDDISFEGFRLTRQPSPWIGDYGHLAIMPTSRAGDTRSKFRYSQYSSKDAAWHPYELKAHLISDGITASLVPSESGAIMRFTFSRPEKYIGIHLFEGDNRFRFEKGVLLGSTTAAADGGNSPLREYFYMTFSELPLECVFFEENETRLGEHIEGNRLSARLRFSSDVVEMRLAVSYLSAEFAFEHAERELDGYEAVRSRAKAAWEKELSAIDVDLSGEEKKTFYSCLYRASLFPRRFYERDGAGEQWHLHPITRQAVRGVMYTDNGFWDTYRTLFPLYSLIQPKLYAEMLEGFCNFSEETGALPRWLSPYERGTMPGSCMESIVADAAVKGILTKDLAKRFLPILMQQTHKEYPNSRQGRQGIKQYLEGGYLPFDLYPESVSKTLDYAYADYCVGVVQKYLGEDDGEMLQRSKNYRTLFDEKTGFFRGRDSKGNFRTPFEPKDWGRDYTESNAWQNTFSVYHDLDGLAALYGGRENALAKLDALFSESNDYRMGGYRLVIHEMCESMTPDLGQCAICNQPSFHLPWIYAAYGQPQKTEQILDKILPYFRSDPCGFVGDEDNGTMASWYLFAMLGIYPVCPGKAEYVQVTPRVNATLHCGEREVRFIKGKTPEQSKISHDELLGSSEHESVEDKVG